MTDNIQTTEEILQCFDENRNPTEGQPRSLVKIEPRKYWCGVSNIWVVNKKGQLLCSKRVFLRSKGNSGKWQSYFGGHLQLGSSFGETAVKELKEEAGIAISLEDLFLVDAGRYEHEKKFYENFVILYDGPIDLSKTDGEVTEVRWLDMDRYWQESQIKNPENWCHACKPEHQKVIRAWLARKLR